MRCSKWVPCLFVPEGNPQVLNAHSGQSQTLAGAPATVPQGGRPPPERPRRGWLCKAWPEGPGGRRRAARHDKAHAVSPVHITVLGGPASSSRGRAFSSPLGAGTSQHSPILSAPLPGARHLACSATSEAPRPSAGTRAVVVVPADSPIQGSRAEP